MATKISDLINPTVRDVVPWSEGTEYVVDRIVLVGNSLLKCIQTHISSPSVIADIQASKWFTLSPFPMSKNEREEITSPVNGTQILQNDDIPYVYTYLNGNWMLQNYTASFLRVVSSAKQAPVVNTSVKFGMTECSLGSSITYNDTTGIFTLLGGGIYEFKGGLGTCYSNASSGWISSTWQKSIDGTNWTNVGMARIDLTNVNPWNHVPNINDAGGTLGFNQTTYLRYIPTTVNTVSQIGDNSLLPQAGINQYSWAEIREVSRSNNFKVTLSSDYIQEWKEYTPTITCTGSAFHLANTYTIKGMYKIVGKSMLLKFNYSHNSNTGTNEGGTYTLPYQISIPSGITIDTSIANIPSLLLSTTSNGAGRDALPLGTGIYFSGNLPLTIACKIVPLSSSTLGVHNTSSGTTVLNTLWGCGNSYYGAANVELAFMAEVPIL